MTLLLDPPSSFEVVAEKSGAVCLVTEECTIAEALATAGVKTKIGCSSGACGTCITQVLEGIAEHHDIFLTEAEKRVGKVLICCARALSRSIVLDI